MTNFLTIVAILACLLGLGALAVLWWLGRSLTWSTIEDDAPADGERPHPLPWLAAWLKPRSRRLTYRRDRRGRFRRHRR